MKAGAPKKQVFFNDVLKLHAMGFTQVEAAKYIGVSECTLRDRIKEVYGCGYKRFIKDGKIDRELPDDADILDYTGD